MRLVVAVTAGFVASLELGAQRPSRDHDPTRWLMYPLTLATRFLPAVHFAGGHLRGLTVDTVRVNRVDADSVEVVVDIMVEYMSRNVAFAFSPLTNPARFQGPPFGRPETIVTFRDSVPLLRAGQHHVRRYAFARPVDGNYELAVRADGGRRTNALGMQIHAVLGEFWWLRVDGPRVYVVRNLWTVGTDGTIDHSLVPGPLVRSRGGVALPDHDVRRRR